MTILLIMIGCTMVFAMLDNAAGGTAGMQGSSILDRINNFNLLSLVNPLEFADVLIFNDRDNFIGGLVDAALFNYGMFETGSYVWVKYVFWTMGLSWIVAFAFALRGTSSA